MSGWWHDPDAPWRAALAGLLFPGVPTEGDADPAGLSPIIAEHRLAPWLHARWPDADGSWKDEAHAAMARALHQRQTLGELLDLLEAEGIQPVLLKGTPLALFAYAQPWQRPMRDLDLLLGTPDEALAAYRALLADGYRPFAEAGDPEALLGERHQLPVLLAPDEESFVELHNRLFHGTVDETPLHPPVERDAAERTVRVLTPEAQLLHLVGHAARDHRFDNGPQVLIDLALLWSTSAIEGSRLRALAGPVGLERHGALLLHMAADAFPDAGIDRSAFACDVPPEAAQHAWRLMTSPMAEVGGARDRLATRRGGLGRTMARLFPSPARLASAQGAGTGVLGLPARYARHYARLASGRLPRMLERSASDTTLARLVDWLED